MANTEFRVSRFPSLLALSSTLVTLLLASGSVAAQATAPLSDEAAMFDGGERPYGLGQITVRRTLGVAFLAGSAMLTSRGFQYKDDADDFYTAYKGATDPVEIDKFYQRTTNRDVKSQVSWALAAAFGITGLRLLITGGPEALPDTAPGFGSADTVQPPLALMPTVAPQALGLRLQRRFY